MSNNGEYYSIPHDIVDNIALQSLLTQRRCLQNENLDEDKIKLIECQIGRAHV